MDDRSWGPPPDDQARIDAALAQARTGDGDSGMDDLVAFVRVRLDEDEATASAARPHEEEPTRGTWTAYQQQPGPIDDPARDVSLVGCVEETEKEWVVAETGQWDRSPQIADHIARHDPARALREVEAKRRLLDVHRPYAPEPEQACLGCAGGIEWERCPVVQALAAVYADHPDYRPEWKP